MATVRLCGRVWGKPFAGRCPRPPNRSPFRNASRLVVGGSGATELSETSLERDGAPPAAAVTAASGSVTPVSIPNDRPRGNGSIMRFANWRSSAWADQIPPRATYRRPPHNRSGGYPLRSTCPKMLWWRRFPWLAAITRPPGHSFSNGSRTKGRALSICIGCGGAMALDAPRAVWWTSRVGRRATASCADPAATKQPWWRGPSSKVRAPRCELGWQRPGT
jgi:hypothetical protein